VNQVTKPSIPARATRVIQERCSASSSRNQVCRVSISLTATVVIPAVWADSRRAMAERVFGEDGRDLSSPFAAAIG
jgi:hypothetical protein